MCIFWFMSDYQLFGMCAFNPNVCSSYFPLFYAWPTFTTGLQFRRKGHLTKQNEFLLFYLSTTSETRFFYSCSRICFQRPVFELCKIWIKKLNNYYSTTEWFSAKRHKLKHRKSWKLLNWDQLQLDFPNMWMGISSWEVHNIIRKGQTNLPTCAKLKLSQPFKQTPGRT